MKATHGLGAKAAGLPGSLSGLGAGLGLLAQQQVIAENASRMQRENRELAIRHMMDVQKRVSMHYAIFGLACLAVGFFLGFTVAHWLF